MGFCFPASGLHLRDVIAQMNISLFGSGVVIQKKESKNPPFVEALTAQSHYKPCGDG